MWCVYLNVRGCLVEWKLWCGKVAVFPSLYVPLMTGGKPNEVEIFFTYLNHAVYVEWANKSIFCEQLMSVWYPENSYLFEQYKKMIGTSSHSGLSGCH